jgi:hypothetical protein
LVPTRKSRVTREEVDKTTTRRHEKKGNFKGKVYQKQKTSEPYTHFSQKGETTRD